MQDTPVYDRTSHDLFHYDIADPACGFCDESWARQRHPSGDALAEARERAQHDQAAADAAVAAQDDRFLARMVRVFTVLATLFLVGGPILAFTMRPLTGWHLLAVLLVVAGAACCLAAGTLHDRRGGEDR